MRKSTTASGPRKVEGVTEPTQLVDMLSKLTYCIIMTDRSRVTVLTHMALAANCQRSALNFC